MNKDLETINKNMGTYKDVKTGSGRLSQCLFTGSYTLSEIQTKLDSIYSKAPEVVDTRRNTIKKGVEAIKKLGDSVYANNNWNK
jgi:hypothetical protein